MIDASITLVAIAAIDLLDLFDMKEKTAKRIIESVHDGYNTIAGEFANRRKGLHWPTLERFRQYISNGDRVLDLGCGSGRAFGLFIGMAVDYEGLDISEGLIKQAKKACPDILASFRVGSMLTLPYEDNSFDSILAIASLHHIPSDRFRLQALREAYRVLKPGGYLLMTNWDLWQPRRWPHLLKNIFLKLIGKSDLGWTDVMIPWHLYQQPTVWRYYHGFTLRELKRACNQVGFKIVFNRRQGQGNGGKDGNIMTICRRPC